jgi:hypothetical protein
MNLVRGGTTALLALLCLTGLACAAEADKADKPEAKGETIELGDLKAKVPADWKKEEPKDRMRTYQFKLPKAEGDDEAPELVVFYFPGGGGGAEANVKRQLGAFVPPDGKKIEDVAKTDKFKVGDAQVTYLDITASYKGLPFAPLPKPKENYRELYAVVEGKETFFVRVLGPAKSVEAAKKGFDEWLKALK